MNWVTLLGFSLMAFGISQVLSALRDLEEAIHDLESELFEAPESDDE